MIKLFKAMANFMKKLKKKRRLSSELHTRWGDPSISYPNEGSWNQWNQPSGFVANATSSTSREIHSDEPRRYIAVGTMSSQIGGGGLNDYGSHSLGERDLTHPPSTIPKGYFDERIRHRNGRAHRPHIQGLGVAGTPHGLSNGHDATADDESCDEEDEERDTLGDPGGGSTYHGYNPRDEHDPYGEHASRSPPLSVTSRMRRVSMNSATTEHSASAAGTASSRHTSFTAASSVSVPSVSVPSLPPETPRHLYSGIQPLHVEKRAVHAPRVRHREAEPAVRHEMVPSYDELYG